MPYQSNYKIETGIISIRNKTKSALARELIRIGHYNRDDFTWDKFINWIILLLKRNYETNEAAATRPTLPQKKVKPLRHRTEDQRGRQAKDNPFGYASRSF